MKEGRMENKEQSEEREALVPPQPLADASCSAVEEKPNLRIARLSVVTIVPNIPVRP
jgi:hypothetical protein